MPFYFKMTRRVLLFSNDQIKTTNRVLLLCYDEIIILFFIFYDNLVHVVSKNGADVGYNGSNIEKTGVKMV